MARLSGIPSAAVLELKAISQELQHERLGDEFLQPPSGKPRAPSRRPLLTTVLTSRCTLTVWRSCGSQVHDFRRLLAWGSAESP